MFCFPLLSTVPEIFPQCVIVVHWLKKKRCLTIPDQFLSIPQSSFFGRLRHVVDIIDPRTLFVSEVQYNRLKHWQNSTFIVSVSGQMLSGTSLPFVSQAFFSIHCCPCRDNWESVWNCSMISNMGLFRQECQMYRWNLLWYQEEHFTLTAWF